MTKILIIDDDFDFADLTRRRIERLGFDVKMHVGARGAMDQLLHGGFDLVILDVKMPDIDGPAMIRMIRTLGTGEIKVIFYSSSDNNALRRLAEEHGAQGYLNKNATTEELEVRLRQLSGPPRAERRTATNSSLQALAPGPAPLSPVLSLSPGRKPTNTSLRALSTVPAPQLSPATPVRGRVPNTSAPPTSRRRS